MEIRSSFRSQTIPNAACEQVKSTEYLEKRPLKKALTSNCGFGMIPAFR